MTYLSSPAAETAQGGFNTMSDVIDSLKRLERIGDENSKTVEKIIKAAEELEKTIAYQYRNSAGASINGSSILSRLAKADGKGPLDAAKSRGLDYSRILQMKYEITWAHSYSYSVQFGDGGDRVSANREAALRFARDIASGLLTLLEHDLLQRHNDEEQAMNILAHTLPAMEEPAE
jgi:hypothetical protein